ALRLRPGVSWAEAGAEMAALADPSLRRTEADGGLRITHGAIPLQAGLTEASRRPLLLLWGAVGLVLVIAMVNLAGLLLARASSRTREIATRLALGGGRGAVIRQLLAESALIAGIGGALGLAVGAAGVRALQAMADQFIGPGPAAVLDGRVVAVTAVLTAVTALAVGLVPALQASRLDLAPALAAGGTRSIAGGARGWARRVLVVAEVALGMTLLVGAGLLLRTFMALTQLPPGFDARNVVAISASLDDARYRDHDAVLRLFDEGLARLRALPGVESVAVSLGLPYDRILNMGARIVGAGGEAEGDGVFTTATYVTPGYFETLAIPVVAGRAIGAGDGEAGAPVVVVNETFVRRYLADGAAIGRQVAMSGELREIVGVVGDVRQRGGFNGYGPVDALPGVYLPAAQFPASAMAVVHTWFTPSWVVRTAGPAAVAEPALRRAMREAAPGLAVADVRALTDVRAAATGEQRMLTLLVGLLGGAALLLAAIGIHGLIASGVAERTRELGIRLALGATVGGAVRAAALPGIHMALVGLAAGAFGALAATRFLGSLLWGVSETDPLTFVLVALTLLAVAVVASVLPALRVRRMDPVALLRE
ncbi:MAG: FtsX-like permease family protein, partial [Vicinamibacterales bacterium]